MADGSAPLAALLRFALFAAIAIVGPGLGLQRLARVRRSAALVLPLGLVFSSLASWLALVSGRPWLFAVLALGACALALLPRPPLDAQEAAPPASDAAAEPTLRGALLPLAVLVGLFALTQYRSNRVDREGAFLLDVGEHVDTALHVGLTFELVAGDRPEVPGFAGVPMRYHVASHLVRAAAFRWAGIHPYDALNRFDLTLWAAALVLALRAAAAAAGLGRSGVAAAGFVPLACDLSFLPGLWRGASWWAQRLGGNFLDPLFFANSLTPALAIALAAIVALARAEAAGNRGEAGRAEGRGFLALAAALAVGAVFFKVFTGAQLLFALVGSGLAAPERAFGPRRRMLLTVALPAATALGALVLASGAPDGVTGVAVQVVPFAAAVSALIAFSLPVPHGAAYVAAGLAWLALSLGLRALGVPAAWRAFRQGSLAARALGALALCGWPLALVLRITADPDFDENTYFLQASGLVLWLFALPALTALARRSRLAVAAAVAFFVLPSTAEFVVRKATAAPERFAPAKVAAMQALAEASCPGDVVITRPQPSFVPLPMVLAGRRVAFSNYLGYWRQFVSPETLDERNRAVRAFFRARTQEAALSIAAALGARHLYLTDRQQVDFPPDGVLEPVFARDGERVYRIAPLARGCEPTPLRSR